MSKNTAVAIPMTQNSDPTFQNVPASCFIVCFVPNDPAEGGEEPVEVFVDRNPASALTNARIFAETVNQSGPVGPGRAFIREASVTITPGNVVD